MSRVFLAIAACAAILTVSQTTIKVLVPSTVKVLLADDGPLPPPEPPDPPSVLA